MEIPPFFTLFTSLMITFPSIFLESSINALDFLAPGQSLTYPKTLTSPGGTFELGFFSPKNSSNYYLAIQYGKIPEDNLVWIANRDLRIPTPSASLSIYPDGNMWIKDGRKFYQVTNNSATNNTLVKLLDSGNLLLTRRGVNEVIWQSFDYPTATLLPGMKLGYEYQNGYSSSLVSWTSSEDPTPGAFSLAIDLRRLVIKKGDTIYWKGSLSEWNFTGSGTFHDFNDSTTCQIVLDVYGQLKQKCWSEEDLQWYSVQKRCEFRSCGSFSLCNESATTLSPCSCLDGFQPSSSDKWNKGETSEGCVRQTSLGCNNGTHQPFRDGLVLNVRFPSNPLNLDVSAAECRSAYLRNCSLIAYGFDNKCLVWDQDLFDVQPLPFGDPSQVLYYKIAASEYSTQGPSARTRQGLRGWQKQALILVGILLGLLATLGLFICSRSNRNRFKKGEDLLLFDMGMSLKPASIESTEEDKVGEGRKREIKLPLFSFSSVSAATDNFSAANKLGEGGFGPVYKGKLLSGEEVAVKRLSRRSGQGWEELENEALLIAKLQHKNLVRLLGCCTERDEKILIYEYMPNKSLDFFLFDPSKRRLLDWETRIRIVEGVAQGLLYLHQYSRLRIIHRDLKASNILLDRDMNPKISDFGLARIFGGNESEANTNRIVGTYGYMSPEYALEGLFSIKSDVFSFGVLLLEIVSGKKNTGLYQTASLNLLGHAWEMWTSDRVLDLMDPVLELGPFSTHLPLRFVHIGLLCVQDSAADRPTMSDVVSMLSNESVILPSPKEPAFSNIRGTTAQKLPVNSPKSLSANSVTVSTVQAR